MNSYETEELICQISDAKPWYRSQVIQNQGDWQHILYISTMMR